MTKKSTTTEHLVASIAALQKEVDKISSEIQKIDSNGQQLTYLEKNVERIEKNIEKIVAQLDAIKKEINDELKENYVNIDKFEPVKIIVFGIAGMVLIAVLAALLGIVVLPTP